jgi:hypothetical protein
MKYITSLAVLATAALMVANTNAADSYAPTSVAGESVRFSRANGLQVNPASAVRILGYTGTNTTVLTTVGTNFVAKPLGPGVLQYITAVADINFVTNNPSATSGASWQARILIDANGTNRNVTIPATWITNSIAPVYAVLTNGTYQIIELDGIDTDVFVKSVGIYGADAN